MTPALGSVAGGTRIELAGGGLSTSTTVAIGGIACTGVTVDAGTLSCVTGSSDFVEGAMDVVAQKGGEQAMLPGAFTYRCLFTTSAGRESCGAAPPRAAPEQTVAAWITQFQADHGFTPAAQNTGATNMADTSDFVLGTQSVSLSTDGAGGAQNLIRVGAPATDFTDRDLKIWVKVENVVHLRELYVLLGDSGLQNYYRFKISASQGQLWMTEGDWVSFAIPFSAENYVLTGTPNRAAITDIEIRAADDALGSPVRVHVNGLALIDEPVQQYPQGVVSFTFDDNYSTMVDPGFSTLAAHGFPGTAYVIVDMVGKPGHASLDDLHAMQTAGWDISVHANTDLHHSASYVGLPLDVVEDDMVDARAWLIANHFKGYDHCGYPSGEFDDLGVNALPLARKYFTSCRTIFHGQQETSPPSDAAKLRVLYVTVGVTLATVEAEIDHARESREWLILVFHRLVPAPALMTEWSSADFAALADYVTASGVTVKPVSSVLAP